MRGTEGPMLRLEELQLQSKLCQFMHFSMKWTNINNNFKCFILQRGLYEKSRNRKPWVLIKKIQLSSVEKPTYPLSWMFYLTRFPCTHLWTYEKDWRDTYYPYLSFRHDWRDSYGHYLSINGHLVREVNFTTVDLCAKFQELVCNIFGKGK